MYNKRHDEHNTGLSPELDEKQTQDWVQDKSPG
jgi:hypothetical protein